MSAILDDFDWQQFIDEYHASSTAMQKALHLYSQRSHFSCCPDWVEEKVWGLFLQLLKER